MKAIVEFDLGKLIIVDSKIVGNKSIVSLFESYIKTNPINTYSQNLYVDLIKDFSKKHGGKILKLDYKIESKPGVIY